MLEEKAGREVVEGTADDTISIQFTPNELQVIVSLLDIAVRTRGLDVAANAVVIHEKIKKSVGLKSVG